jgi:hypothetical protein
MSFKPMLMDLETRTNPSFIADAVPDVIIAAIAPTNAPPTPPAPAPSPSDAYWGTVCGIDGLPLNPIIVVDVPYWGN